MNIEIIMAIIGFISLLVAGLVALLGDQGVLNFLDRPDVRYIRTHLLRKGNQFVQGILLTNRGRKCAMDIILKIHYKNAIINEIQIDSQAFLKQPSIEEGGKGDKFIVLSCYGLHPKSQGTIYVTIDNEEENINIQGNFDTQIIKEETYGYKRPLSDTIAILFGLFAFFWMTLGLFL